MRKGIIFDGYVDEPACFGVPPYISPYVRYCAGAMYDAGLDVELVTADRWRRDRARFDASIADADITVVICGLTVPGRYRGGSPLTMRELDEISSSRRRGEIALCGPATLGYALRGGATAKKLVPDGVDHVSGGDADEALAIYLSTGEWPTFAAHSYADMDARAVAGAIVARQHPNFPQVIAELEASVGCDRTDGRCSFCTEGAFAAYRERSPEGAAREAAALSAAGVRAFRIGRCANILAYGADRSRGVVPSADRLRELYEGIRSGARDLEVLHTDNCCPASIVRFPEEAARALEVIATFGTEGDGLSLGLESLDDAVVAANSLKVDAEGAFFAVRMINEIGGARKDLRGMPSLLPGLNFLFGLDRESRATLDANTRFLRRVLDAGLAVRRINIRRAMLFEGTSLRARADRGELETKIKERDYKKWKTFVREEIDREMLARVAPDGTIIRRVIIEEREGAVAFGRPLGSYPPLVGVVSDDLAPGDVVDAAVCGRGARSLTALPYPLDIRRCTRRQLEELPGVGRARAEAMIRSRVCARGHREILRSLDDASAEERLAKYFE